MVTLLWLYRLLSWNQRSIYTIYRSSGAKSTIIISCVFLRCDLIWYDMIWYDTIWSDLILSAADRWWADIDDVPHGRRRHPREFVREFLDIRTQKWATFAAVWNEVWINNNWIIFLFFFVCFFLSLCLNACVFYCILCFFGCLIFFGFVFFWLRIIYVAIMTLAVTWRTACVFFCVLVKLYLYHSVCGVSAFCRLCGVCFCCVRCVFLFYFLFSVCYFFFFGVFVGFMCVWCAY